MPMVTKSRRSLSSAPQVVRIIGGQWRRTQLPVADKPGLRPTPDRVRETLFNWLGQDLHGWRCVDAFAGSGALGFEAASRGASEVLMIERDPSLVAQLHALKERLHADAIRVQRGDGVAGLNAYARAGADLIFLDPPFDDDLFQPALNAAALAIQPDGWVYLEAPYLMGAEDLSQAGWSLYRHLKAGAVHAHLLRPAIIAPDSQATA